MKIPFPSKKDYMVYFVYRQGKCLVNNIYFNDPVLPKMLAILLELKPTAKLPDVDALIQMFHGKGFVIERVFKSEEYDATKFSYREQQTALIEHYKKDLFSAYNLDDFDLAEMIYQRAYDRCHSEGYPAIEDRFGEEVEYAEKLIAHIQNKNA